MEKACETCGSTTCPGAPAFKGFCRLLNPSPYASLPTRHASEPSLREAPLEFARCKLEPGQRRTVQTAQPFALYRGLRVLFDPLTRDLVVHSLTVGPGTPSLNHVLGPTTALVLTNSKLWISTLDVSQFYVLDIENLGKSTLDLCSWVEGVWVD